MLVNILNILQIEMFCNMLGNMLNEKLSLHIKYHNVSIGL